MDRLREKAEAICLRLREAGHQALLAGGCVRDALLGERPKDYDVATSATPDEVMALFERTVPVGVAFGVVLVVTEAGPFEVATFRNDGRYEDGRRPASVTFTDAKEDALRRDFTINAMFLDPVTGEIVDYVGGRDDLRARVVRCVGDPERRFDEDRLRLLRAVRFAARLGFEIEPKTGEAVRAHAGKVTSTSPERIRDELVAMFTGANPGTALRKLHEYGLLQQVLPEVAAMDGVEQPPEFHPEGDVFTHTCLMLDALHAPSPTLAFGALLHDVGKPGTQTFEDRIRFNGHPELGAEMADRICARLKFSNAERERIVWLVLMHMRVAVLPEMREAKRKRMIRTPGFEELLALCLADCEASHRDTSGIRWVLDYMEQLPIEPARPKPLIDGKRLIELGYTPGPVFKEILSAVEDLQLEGELTDAAQAEAWVSGEYPQDGG